MISPATGALEEHLFRQLVESVRDYAIFVLDPEGRVRSWNAGAQIIKGYSSDEIIGSHFSRFYTPEDLAAGRPQMLLEVATTAGRVEDSGWRVRKDGSRFWADVIITAVRNDSGRLLGFTKVTRDMTARRLAEEQLRRSEERARLIIDGVTDYAIFMLDPEGKVTTWNRGAERMKGYRAEEIIGTSFERFYDDDGIRAGKPAVELTVAARDGRFEDEGWRVRKDGTKFWANVVVSPLRDSTGQLVGYAKVTRDLSERLQLEQERIRSARAEEAVRLRDEFLAVVSHELRTPLTAVLLGLHGVHEQFRQTDERLASRLDRVLRSGQRLSRLVEELLDVSRMVAGRFSLRKESLELHELVEQVVEGLRPNAERSQTELVLRGDSEILGNWDRVRLEQVVSNLLDNGIKFGAGHRVEVLLFSDVNDARIEVCDRGPGVDDADLERIFERFERAASIRHHAGLGLGLYIAQRIVVAHGGTLSVTRREGGGSRFVVRLPRIGTETTTLETS